MAVDELRTEEGPAAVPRFSFLTTRPGQAAPFTARILPTYPSARAHRGQFSGKEAPSLDKRSVVTISTTVMTSAIQEKELDTDERIKFNFRIECNQSF